MRRVAEQRQNAFTILVPHGWGLEGGTYHLDPNQMNGPANSIDTKIDFAVKSDPGGTIMLHVYPEIYYCDTRNSNVGGIFTPGTKYNGMPVVPLMGARDFLMQTVQSSHPQATGMQLLDSRPLPALARGRTEFMSQLADGVGIQCDAASVAIQYVEGGVCYVEKGLTVIENWGSAAAGMWANRWTITARAPAAAGTSWDPVLGIILSSFRFNSPWLVEEIKGQAYRSGVALKTQADIQRIEQEIVEHRSRTNAEINNDMFLTIMGQEEYVNPHTGEIEVGTNAYPYRWEDASGGVVYSTLPSYDPNFDPHSTRSDYRRSQVRPRFPR